MSNDAVPKARRRLNDASLKAARAKPPQKRDELYGSNGLFAVVHPTGKITFYYRYRFGGKRVKVRLGRYPALSLKAAGRLHKKHMGEVAVGTSPADEARKQRRIDKSRVHPNMAVRDFVPVYVEDMVRPNRKDVTLIEHYLRAHVVDAIGNVPMNQVTREQVWGIIDRIKARGRLQSANVIRGLLKRMFDYAQTRAVVTVSPVAAIRAKDVGPLSIRKRALEKPELGQFLRKLYASSTSRQLKLALHLIVLTMVRKSELRLAKWKDVDLDAAEWLIPAKNTKTEDDHVVYLSRQAVDMFKELKAIAGTSMLVLPSRSSIREPIASSTLNTIVRGLGVGIEHFTIHDMRRTASTLLHDLDWPSDVIEKALGHKIGGVRGIYNRAKYKDQRKLMLQAWADLVDDAIGENKVVVGRFRPTA